VCLLRGIPRNSAVYPREQLDLGLAGEADVVYGYSFILTDLDGDAATVEHHHRDRAQIEERIKDAKLGVSLRRLPLSDLDANRVWLACSALALNLLALLNDLMFGPKPPGHLPRRRQAKFVRRMLLCVPARVIYHARQIILRLPAGLPSAPAFQTAYSAARGLAPPALAA
jgi:Transposase DDE domain group 1